MHEIEPGQGGEGRAGEMRRRAAAGRRVADASWLCLGQRNQLVDALRRQRRMHDHHQRLAADARHGRKVGDGIVAQVLIEADVDRVRLAGTQHERVAVRRRTCSCQRTQRAAGAHLVLDGEPLSERFRELLGDLTGDEVGAGPRRIRHDEPDRPRRIILRRATAHS
jgi:hypothetical protein